MISGEGGAKANNGMNPWNAPLLSNSILSTARLKPRYPSDVEDTEWEFVQPYLAPIPLLPLPRAYDIRDTFNALRYVARTGIPWCYLPESFPPWEVVAAQAQRWIVGGCFETLAHDLRQLLRVAAQKESSTFPTGNTLGSLLAWDVTFAEIEESLTDTKPASGKELALVSLPQATRGFVLLPHHWVVEPSFLWRTRFCYLAREYEQLPERFAA